MVHSTKFGSGYGFDHLIWCLWETLCQFVVGQWFFLVFGWKLTGYCETLLHNLGISLFIRRNLSSFAQPRLGWVFDLSCASDFWDEHAHLCSLIRAFAVCLRHLWTLWYSQGRAQSTNENDNSSSVGWSVFPGLSCPNMAFGMCVCDNSCHLHACLHACVW